MIEITQLKEKKLPELQANAKERNSPKFKRQKNIHHVQQRLD